MLRMYKYIEKIVQKSLNFEKLAAESFYTNPIIVWLLKGQCHEMDIFLKV